MPRVPNYQQQFPYNSPQVAGPRLRGFDVRTNAAMFGGAAGRQLEQAGRDLQDLAYMGARIADDYNTTVARDAAVQMQRGFCEWQGEAQQKQGREGLHLASDYEAWSESRVQELTKDMNETQRERFGMLVEQRMGGQRRWAEQYAEQQRQRYGMDTWQAEMSTAADLLSANIQYPELAEAALEQLRDAAFTMARSAGFEEQDIKRLMVKSVQEPLRNAIAARLATGETHVAEALLDYYGERLTPNRRTALEAQIQQAREAVVSGGGAGGAELAGSAEIAGAAEAAGEAEAMAPAEPVTETSMLADNAEPSDTDEVLQQALSEVEAEQDDTFDPLAGPFLTAAKGKATDAKGKGKGTKGGVKKTQTPPTAPKPKPAPVTLYERIEHVFPYFEKTLQQIYNEAGVTIPIELAFTFMIIESSGEVGLKSKDSSASGFMQVNERTRKYIKSKKGFNTEFAADLANSLKDDSPYYGMRYMMDLAKQSNIDIESPYVFETAKELYKSYFMGPTGAREFNKLEPEQTVDKGLGSYSIDSNPELLKHNALQTGKPASKKVVEERIVEKVQKAYVAMKKNLRLYSEKQRPKPSEPYETGVE